MGKRFFIAASLLALAMPPLNTAQAAQLTPVKKTKKTAVKKKAVQKADEAKSVADSVFIYSPSEKDGMHIAVLDNGSWKHLGQIFASDYGPWGSDKKMYEPYMLRDNGKWYATWAVNSKAPCFAVAYSEDLIVWRPQDYPDVNLKALQGVKTQRQGDGLNVTFTSGGKAYKVKASDDFRQFSAPSAIASVPATDALIDRTIDGKAFKGQVFDITAEKKKQLQDYFSWVDEENRKAGEDMNKDGEQLLPKLKLTDGKATVNIAINSKNKKAISNNLVGIFFEDISYAADGGLYAEMVQNRDFEYTGADHKDWNATTAWKSDKEIKIAESNPLSAVNSKYAVLSEQKITNEGWDGFYFKKGDNYLFSFFARLDGTKKKEFTVQLLDGSKAIATAVIKAKGEGWQKYEAVLTATATTGGKDGRLSLEAKGKGEAAVDMISLFPEKTFMGRKNGMRRDLAETIAALHPRFVRFPGGCMSHGQGVDNIYHWNETVGELQDRKPAMNIWHYHQTRGLGFFEYFQFCEDIGAEPLPVLAAGVPCQNSTADERGYAGQQGGIPMADMPAYIEEILNLIEWANGDPATSKWAKMRADAGHPTSFNLKYLGIGNEDIISTAFEERFKMIVKAVNEKYPDIKVCGTVGPFHYPSSDYVEGWKFAKEAKDINVYMEDEHYYESPGWFLNHQDYYDNYDRNGQKVYLGEYASRGRTVQNALVEAMHLSACERNGDIVAMTSYAPLLARDGHHNWNPDMIYFGNDYVTTTPSYETQRLFSDYRGEKYIETKVNCDSLTRHRVAVSMVENNHSGCRYLKITNSLPVPLKVSLSGIEVKLPLRYEGFSGKPSDKKISVESGNYAPGEIELPAYSFRVIQICNF